MNLLFMILLFYSVQANAAKKTVKYDPAVVILSGTLDLQTFPGPPNYESIKGGDDVERHFYLKLDTPFDVIADTRDLVDTSETERNVRIVQLAINEDEKLWSRFRGAGKGAHVTVTGTLFHRFTGHHHARILVDVTGLNP